MIQVLNKFDKLLMSKKFVGLYQLHPTLEVSSKYTTYKLEPHF
jgi:hypothetical protein